MKVRHETQPFEMCVRSPFGQVSRFFGDPKRNRGQPRATQIHNGLTSSYLQEMSTIIDWEANRPLAVHMQFHKLAKAIFYHVKGGQKDWLE